MTITIKIWDIKEYMQTQHINDPVRAFREVAYNLVWHKAPVLPQVVRNWVENQNFYDEHFTRMIEVTDEGFNIKATSIEIVVPSDVGGKTEEELAAESDLERQRLLQDEEDTEEWLANR